MVNRTVSISRIASTTGTVAMIIPSETIKDVTSTLASASDRPRSTYSILVVDDDRPIVQCLHEFLEEEGFRVHDAYAGDQAISILAKAKPHLIISDIEMPAPDGRDILRFVTENDESPIKLIFMSGTPQQQSSSLSPLIEKPFDLGELLELIDTTLEPE